MASVALVGSTGLVGSFILSQLLAHPFVSSVVAYSRRDLPNPTSSTKLTTIKSNDTSTWAPQFPTSPTPKVFFSGLGTTRAQAGGFENQKKIDLDLNYDLAKAAKDAGVETYVLISSASASSTSRIPYSAMKGELEDKVRALGFKHTVILRPGLIVGGREDSRPAEYTFRVVANGLGRVWGGLKDMWAQDADVIARAAIKAGLEDKEGVSVLGQKEIIELGKEKQ